MMAILVVSLIFLLVLGLGTFIFWYAVSRRQKTGKEPATKPTAPGLTFRWKYIFLPVAILFLAIILAASFYSFLPAEVAYRFNFDGSPKGWLGRGLAILLLLTPQFLLALIALAITRGTARFSRSAHTESTARAERILLLMGNMVALPQLVVGFVMIDVFSYNIYNMHLLPVWLFALIVMALGGIIMTILFLRTTKPSPTLPENYPQENPKE